MADITARLIWYRLGEVADNVRDYIADDDVDVLDILFAMWVLIALAILLLVYSLEWFSKSRKRKTDTAVTSDQEKWSRLRRQNSFFTMHEVRPAERPVTEKVLVAKTDEVTEKTTAKMVNSVQATHCEMDHVLSNSKPSSRDAGDGSSSNMPQADCQWVNRVILWMYLNYNHCPNWLNGWLRSLNAELENRSREAQVHLEVTELSPGSLPPKILSLVVEPGADTRGLFIRTRVSATEFGFVVQLERRTSGDISRCHVIIRKFIGELRVASEVGENSEGIRVLVKFVAKPQMDVTAMLPVGERQTVDYDWVKRQVISAFESSVTELTFREPNLVPKGDSRGVDAVLAESVAKTGVEIRLTPPCSHGDSESVKDKTEAVEEEAVVATRTSKVQASAAASSGDREASKSKSGRRSRHDSDKKSTIPRFYSGQRTFANRNSNTNGSISRPLLFSEGQRSPSVSPMRSPVLELAKGQSILAKVIKVAGLLPGHRGKERKVSCVVELDEPYQRQLTHPVRSSNTAFWDHSFVLDLNSNSHRMTFTVFEGDVVADGALGHTIVPVRELMAHPSSRQIIPLTDSATRRRRRERDGSSASGQMSITVEFLFLRPESSPSFVRPMASSRTEAAPILVLPPAPASSPPLSSSASSSSSSGSSDSSGSSSTSPPLTPTKVCSSRSQPQAVVIASNGADAIVTSRDLINFMTPPTAFQPLTPSPPRPINSKAGVGVGRSEPAVLVYRDVRDPVRVALNELCNQKAGGGGSPGTIIIQNFAPRTDQSSSTLSRDTSEKPRNVNRREERGRTEKPEKKTEPKRSRSFASRLRKTLSSSRNKERSQSADRLSSSLQPPPLPPSEPSPRSSHSSLQKSKSLGLSGSFRRLFGGKREKKNAANQGPPKFVGGGPLSHSSPHLAPHPPLLTAAAPPARPLLKPQQQPFRVIRAAADETSSYSSEGYNISQDFREPSDTSV